DPHIGGAQPILQQPRLNVPKHAPIALAGREIERGLDQRGRRLAAAMGGADGDAFNLGEVREPTDAHGSNRFFAGAGDEMSRASEVVAVELLAVRTILFADIDKRTYAPDFEQAFDVAHDAHRDGAA